MLHLKILFCKGILLLLYLLYLYLQKQQNIWSYYFVCNLEYITWDFLSYRSSCSIRADNIKKSFHYIFHFHKRSLLFHLVNSNQIFSNIVYNHCINQQNSDILVVRCMCYASTLKDHLLSLHNTDRKYSLNESHIHILRHIFNSLIFLISIYHTF